jgi:hypothetical protein
MIPVKLPVAVFLTGVVLKILKKVKWFYNIFLIILHIKFFQLITFKNYFFDKFIINLFSKLSYEI